MATVFVVWLGVMYTIMCFVKWSWNTWIFMTLGGLFSSMVISILIKSTCKRSIGVVDTIGCRGALDNLPSCCRQHVQDYRDFCTQSVIPSHQRCSCQRDKVWSCPWWPASWWHPFRVATQCALGTAKSRRSSVLPLGIECRYNTPWWITKFCQFCRISLPSSLEACSAKGIFRLVYFCAFSQSSTVLNIRSSLWAVAQLVTCISTSGQPAAMCTSCSRHWSPSTMARSWTLVQCAIPKVPPSRIDFTLSRSSLVVTQLSTSVTILSFPFWYSNLKWELSEGTDPSMPCDI